MQSLSLQGELVTKTVESLIFTTVIPRGPGTFTVLSVLSVYTYDFPEALMVTVWAFPFLPYTDTETRAIITREITIER